MKDQPSARDLIELPGPFLFKIIVTPTKTGEAEILAIAKQTLGRAGLRHRIHSKPSRTGKYESFSLQLFIETFDEIEALYEAFGASNGVVMVL